MAQKSVWKKIFLFSDLLPRLMIPSNQFLFYLLVFIRCSNPKILFSTFFFQYIMEIFPYQHLKICLIFQRLNSIALYEWIIIYVISFLENRFLKLHIKVIMYFNIFSVSSMEYTWPYWEYPQVSFCKYRFQTAFIFCKVNHLILMLKIIDSPWSTWVV